MADYFPDLQHIEEVRRALWTESGLGRAAVMVGAGMSRNAEPTGPERSVMPTWQDLVAAMVDRLYPPSASTERRRTELKNQAKATSAALRLAEEFATAFGRPALDDLILTAIPDADFNPGQLHQLLLKLPWADVLTTNYDTLLERAAAATLGQHYSIIRTPEEISMGTRPRIVKLHGSFPSTRPFILTEEDFRTYPHRFAPFVNLAQQAIMENVLCLIGFSSDDPNFLYWTGWVRDHLGPYAPKIYLCGLLDLSDSQRLLLQARNVVPIDFTPLFPTDCYPDAATRHKFALEWFFLSLEKGKPYDVMKWPTAPAVVDLRYPHLPTLLPPSTERRPRAERWRPWDHSEPGEPSPSSAQTRLIEEVATWNHNRGTYPGWLIAPEDVRSRLWERTHPWIPLIVQHASSLSLYQQLALLFELNWRLETQLLPVWDHLAPHYSRVLEAINPFPEAITDLPTAATSLRDETGLEVDKSVLRNKWLTLAFGLLRYRREERQVEAFEVLHDRIGGIRDMDNDWRARWCYERCLFALSRLDDESALSAIKYWPDSTRDAFWSARKGAVLGELGHTQEALSSVEDALQRLRVGLRDDVDHIPSLSREGWAMYLALHLKMSRNFGLGGGLQASDSTQLWARFTALEKLGCSPSDLTGYFDSRLDQPTPQPRPPSQTRPGFEPGTYVRSFGGSDEFGKKLNLAYQYFRVIEEAAQPPRFGKDRIRRVAEWFSDHDPIRTQGIMVRLVDDKVIEHYLSRHRVAALRPEVVLELKKLACDAIHKALPRSPSAARPETDEELRASERLQSAISILARVCVKERDAGLAEMWDLACRLYKEPAIRRGMAFDRRLTSLFDNLASATPQAELANRLPMLLRLPIGGEEGFDVAHPNHWPDAAVIAARSFHGKLRRPPAGWNDIKQRLFESLQVSSTVVKRSALYRLLMMRDSEALSTEEDRRLGRAFWSAVGEAAGLPVNLWGVDDAPRAALEVWEPRGIDAIERVKQYILASQPGTAHPGVASPGSYFNLLVFATEPLRSGVVAPRRRFIPWSRAEIWQLAGVIRTWWETHGRNQAQERREQSWLRAFTEPPLQEFLHHLWDALRWVIIPRMSRRQHEIRMITDLIGEVSATGLPVGAVLPATLLLRPDSSLEVTTRLREEFANPEDGYHLSALRGVMYWVEWNATSGPRRRAKLPAVPVDLLREISTAVALRHPGSVSLSLDFAYNVIREIRDGVDAQFLQNLVVGLHYLWGETAYREKASEALRFAYDDIPLIRCRAARLAKCLSDSGHGADSVIQRWCEAVPNDPLPEIRRIASDGYADVEE